MRKLRRNPAVVVLTCLMALQLNAPSLANAPNGNEGVRLNAVQQQEAARQAQLQAATPANGTFTLPAQHPPRTSVASPYEKLSLNVEQARQADEWYSHTKEAYDQAKGENDDFTDHQAWDLLKLCEAQSKNGACPAGNRLVDSYLGNKNRRAMQYEYGPHALRHNTSTPTPLSPLDKFEYTLLRDALLRQISADPKAREYHDENASLPSFVPNGYTPPKRAAYPPPAPKTGNEAREYIRNNFEPIYQDLISPVPAKQDKAARDLINRLAKKGEIVNSQDLQQAVEENIARALLKEKPDQSRPSPTAQQIKFAQDVSESLDLPILVLGELAAIAPQETAKIAQVAAASLNLAVLLSSAATMNPIQFLTGLVALIGDVLGIFGSDDELRAQNEILADLKGIRERILKLTRQVQINAAELTQDILKLDQTLRRLHSETRKSSELRHENVHDALARAQHHINLNAAINRTNYHLYADLQRAKLAKETERELRRRPYDVEYLAFSDFLRQYARSAEASRRSYATTPDGLSREPLGTGPFRVALRLGLFDQCPKEALLSPVCVISERFRGTLPSSWRTEDFGMNAQTLALVKRMQQLIDANPDDWNTFKTDPKRAETLRTLQALIDSMAKEHTDLKYLALTPQPPPERQFDDRLGIDTRPMFGFMDIKAAEREAYLDTLARSINEHSRAHVFRMPPFTFSVNLQAPAVPSAVSPEQALPLLLPKAPTDTQEQELSRQAALTQLIPQVYRDLEAAGLGVVSFEFTQDLGWKADTLGSDLIQDSRPFHKNLGYVIHYGRPYVTLRAVFRYHTDQVGVGSRSATLAIPSSSYPRTIWEWKLQTEGDHRRALDVVELIHPTSLPPSKTAELQKPKPGMPYATLQAGHKLVDYTFDKDNAPLYAGKNLSPEITAMDFKPWHELLRAEWERKGGGLDRLTSLTSARLIAPSQQATSNLREAERFRSHHGLALYSDLLHRLAPKTPAAGSEVASFGPLSNARSADLALTTYLDSLFPNARENERYIDALQLLEPGPVFLKHATELLHAKQEKAKDTPHDTLQDLVSTMLIESGEKDYQLRTFFESDLEPVLRSQTVTDFLRLNSAKHTSLNAMLTDFSEYQHKNPWTENLGQDPVRKEALQVLSQITGLAPTPQTIPSYGKGRIPPPPPRINSEGELTELLYERLVSQLPLRPCDAALSERIEIPESLAKKVLPNFYPSPNTENLNDKLEFVLATLSESHLEGSPYFCYEKSPTTGAHTLVLEANIGRTKTAIVLKTPL